MNELEEKNELQLWAYIDGSLPPDELLQVEALLQTDARWRERYAELKELHEQIALMTAAEHPSMRFSKNVMEAIAELQVAPASHLYINRNVVRGIATFLIVTISLLTIYTCLNIDWAAARPVIKLPGAITSAANYKLPEKMRDTIVTAMMATGVVLALALTDMWLRRRQQQRHSTEH